MVVLDLYLEEPALLQYFQRSCFTCSKTVNSNLNNCREEVLKDQASGTHALWRPEEHCQVSKNKTEMWHTLYIQIG